MNVTQENAAQEAERIAKEMREHPENFVLPFDAYRSFESMNEAIDYCNSQPIPMKALLAIVEANLSMGEFGFAGDLCWRGGQINERQR